MKDHNDYTLGTLDTLPELIQVEEWMPDWIHVPVSGCCNAYLTDAEAECGVCCECREACDVEIVSLAIEPLPF